MKPTFNQLCAAGLILLSGICLMIVYFHPINSQQSIAVGALIGSAFSTGIMFLLKANSDAQHDTKDAQNAQTLSNAIDGLKNSTPIKN